MTTGVVTDSLAFGQASAASWRAAVDACRDQCGQAARNATLGFVYASDTFADSLGAIVEVLRRRTGIAHWVGTVGCGVCATGREYLDEPSPGAYRHVKEERVTEWPVVFLQRPRRTPRTIPDFLAPDAPANRLEILRGTAR